MKYCEAQAGRVFVLRLQDGEILHEQIEKFAKEKGIKSASVTVVGAADKGSILVVGPEEDRSKPVRPMEYILEHAHEVTGTGTIFLNEKNLPILHMHLSCGRKDQAKTGCIRKGVKIWHVLEVIIQEFIDCSAIRKIDPETSFELLEPNG
ncbi:MAG: DNA-binding protein [Spirochaetes bacterium]|nr:DNA-binding protein [Spirochaetota bacterium]